MTFEQGQAFDFASSPSEFVGPEPMAAARLRIVHAAANVVPESGSMYALVPTLCGLLERNGHDVALLSADSGVGPASRNGFPARGFTAPGWRGRIGYAPDLTAAAERLMGGADAVHIHGLWQHFGAAILRAARQRGVTVIVSPMGAFAPAALRLSRLRKAAFWHALYRPALKAGAIFHATSALERDHMRAFGISGPIAVIAPGVEMGPPPVPFRSRAGERTLLYLGRITPIKNLAALVLAWRSLQENHPRARLRIVGPDDRGHAQALRRLAASVGARGLSIEPGFRDAGELYRSADAAVLPSHSESFGLVVAEALAAGRPVIASTGTPWRIVEEAGCGWWADPGPEPLARALGEALSLTDAELARMGANARSLAQRDLGWPKAAGAFERLYQWASHGSRMPAFVSC